MARATRANTSRDAGSRPAIGGEVEPFFLDLDTSRLPPGVEATWIRETTHGQYDAGNVQKAMQMRGFEPATYDQLGLPAPPVLPGREAETHGLIRRGDCILMTRPKARAEAERRGEWRVNEEITRNTVQARSFKEKALDTGAEVPESENRVTQRESKGEGRFEA